MIYFLLFSNLAVAIENDFTLPTLDGTRFIRLADIQGPTLVNFWGVDCPPCVAELPLLEKFSRNHRQWTVLLIATDHPTAVYDFLARYPVSLTILRRGADVTKLMRIWGNRLAALPFTFALNQRGQICFRKLGALTSDDIDQLPQACAVNR